MPSQSVISSQLIPAAMETMSGFLSASSPFLSGSKNLAHDLRLDSENNDIALRNNVCIFVADTDAARCNFLATAFAWVTGENSVCTNAARQNSANQGLSHIAGANKPDG